MVACVPSVLTRIKLDANAFVHYEVLESIISITDQHRFDGFLQFKKTIPLSVLSGIVVGK